MSKTRYKSKVVKLIWNNSNYISHKHFAHMKGTIYGNRLPRGMKVKKGWGTTLICTLLKLCIFGNGCTHNNVIENRKVKLYASHRLIITELINDGVIFNNGNIWLSQTYEWKYVLQLVHLLTKCGRHFSFSRDQSMVVTGLLTGRNTLCRHLHLMRDSPLCRKCGAEDETSAHILCRCEALASFRHAHLGSFFMEPEDIKHQNLGAIWRFSKAAGLAWGNNWGTKGQLIKRIGASGLKGPEPNTYLSLWFHSLQQKPYHCENIAMPLE
jgi:hypothetical protein